MTVQINLGRVFNLKDYDELACMFLPRGSYELVYGQRDSFEGKEEKLQIARDMYHFLSEESGIKLPWGILTGVKPTKLFSQLVRESEAVGQGTADRLNAQPYDISGLNTMVRNQSTISDLAVLSLMSLSRVKRKNVRLASQGKSSCNLRLFSASAIKNN